MVTPGVTPLPVNQVWLHVQTPLGKKGFVPVQCSWTNVMIDRVRETHPWGDEILEADPTVTYSWDESIWEIINNHRIVIEMTREQVLLSWGEPLERLEKLWDGINRECWLYGSHELYFDTTALISMSERILSD
jgi:hypothetical protein